MTGTQTAILGLVLGVAGLGAGYMAGSQAEPEVRRVEVTPPACAEALDISAEFSDVMVRWPAIAQESLLAGMSYDVVEIERLTDRVAEITADVDELTRRMEAAAPECRGKA